MNTILIDGTALKNEMLVEMKKDVDLLKTEGITPHLCVVRVGDDPASKVYVGHKEKVARKLGMDFTLKHFPESISFEDLEKELFVLNNNEDINGIIVQLPLPEHMSKRDVSSLVSPEKDADGVHPINQGINFTRAKKYAPVPCTANGIMKMFAKYNIELQGKNAVVIGRSNIVGRPMTYLLSNANATVGLVHRSTNDETFKKLIAAADIIVSATGVADRIGPEMVKEGVIIIDVGILRKPGGKLRGDVLYKDFIGKASYITPVPGGVGPMTVTMLMANTIELAKRNKQ